MLGRAWRTVGSPRDSRRELTVFVSHGTPGETERFVSLLDRVRSAYSLISTEQLDEYFTSPESFSEGPYALLTFDDGLRSNVSTARVLASRGISACYFVPPEFLLCKQPVDFFRRNMTRWPLDAAPETLAPMSIDELKELVALGHTVGSHTYSHQLHREMSKAQLDHALVESRGKLEELLGVKVDSLASPFDTKLLDRRIADSILSTYGRHFLTLDGSNLKHGGRLIFRTQLEFGWGYDRFDYALGVRGPERLRWRLTNRTFMRQVLAIE